MNDIFKDMQAVRRFFKVCVWYVVPDLKKTPAGKRDGISLREKEA